MTELCGMYPDASKELDSIFPEPLVNVMKINVFVDLDHAHNQISRRSITGKVIFIRRTPVFYLSKR